MCDFHPLTHFISKMCNSVVFSVVNVEKAGQNARLMSNNKGEWCWLASWQAQWDSGDEVNTFTLLVSGSRLCHAALGLQGWEGLRGRARSWGRFNRDIMEGTDYGGAVHAWANTL